MTTAGETTSYHLTGVITGTAGVEVAYWNGLEEFNDPIILRVENNATGSGVTQRRRRLRANVEYKIDRGSPWVAHPDNTNGNVHRINGDGSHLDVIFNHPVSSVRLTLVNDDRNLGQPRTYDVAIRGRRKKY